MSGSPLTHTPPLPSLSIIYGAVGTIFDWTTLVIRDEISCVCRLSPCLRRERTQPTSRSSLCSDSSEMDGRDWTFLGTFNIKTFPNTLTFYHSLGRPHMCCLFSPQTPLFLCGGSLLRFCLVKQQNPAVTFVCPHQHRRLAGRAAVSIFSVTCPARQPAAPPVIRLRFILGLKKSRARSGCRPSAEALQHICSSQSRSGSPTPVRYVQKSVCL